MAGEREEAGSKEPKENEMQTKIEYKGRIYQAWVSEWTSRESTAVIKIGAHEVMLHWRTFTDRDGGKWYKK